ncbi:LacI family DNA-binding transcriptional regulator [Galbitalea soli]|uniref:LacI family transcriptional regulator n=1 Tax=Galbitalea soli TaxID=1268042 RepID=A0A7C9PPP7_9MICO|nr:LacI family DNA-binding transcriptional regulator [Galbitalea soli]NEM92291.1 LacI family transcriptional regulator [Galbitalea soli]NYJ31753.1 LacI family transcriptional regulator [Galbitalea soli]
MTGRPPSRATIFDVAARAGVSIGTVSNALNRPEAVRPETRERILDAVRDLGFRPNSAAKAMATGQSASIGLVLPDLHNSLYVDIVRGAEEEISRFKHHLLIMNSDVSQEKQVANLGVLTSAGARAVMLSPHNGDLTGMAETVRDGSHVVLVDFPADESLACSVSVDERLGGYLAARHLIEQGYRRIAYVGPATTWYAVGARWEGIERAARETAGVEIESVETPTLTFPDGFDAGQALAHRPEGERPDAIIAAIDLIAVGCVAGLLEGGGLRVPDDVAIIGFDDNYYAAQIGIPISTIAKPGFRMGTEAARVIRREVDEGPEHRHEAVILAPELIVRSSSAPRATAEGAR